MPVYYVTFVFLYRNCDDLTSLSMFELKCILREAVSDRGQLSISRTIEGNTKVLFDLTTEHAWKGSFKSEGPVSIVRATVPMTG